MEVKIQPKSIKRTLCSNPLHSRSLDTNEQVRKIHVGSTGNAPISVNALNGKVGRIVYKNIISSALIDYAKEVNSPNIKEYWAVYNCGKSLTQTDNKYLKQDYYCGSRLCSICSNVRSQKVGDLVLSIIDTKIDWVMLTLTNSNNEIGDCPNKLNNRLIAENKFLNKIKDKWRKRGGDYTGLISLEVVPAGYKKNNNGSTYYAPFHPHYHCLFSNEFAQYVKAEWLKEYKTALPINQKIENIKERANKNNNSEVVELRNAIREVVKYSLKATVQIKKNNKNDTDNKSSYACLNVKAIDDIVTIMKGKRRFKKWGNFYNSSNEFDKIENANIEELDNKKQVYNDLPVKDTGDLVMSVNYRGEIIGECPEFVKNVVWQFDNKRSNYYYVDELNNEYTLTDYKEKINKVMVCKGQKIMKYLNKIL